MSNQPSTHPAGAVPPPILVAVDGTNLVHRAHHAFSGSDRRSTDGAAVWALWGLARMLSTAHTAITERFRAPAGLVVCFDGPKELCRRRAMDPGYKATRRDPDPDLTAQLDAAPRWLADAGLSVAVFDGYEADDGCASAAHVAAAAGWRCVIVTSDRDALTHASTSTRVLRPVNGGGWECYGTPEITAKYGTPPVHGAYGAYSALRGDPSDELAGVAGVGEKTAASVLCALHAVERSVEDVLDGDDVAVAAITPRARKLLVEGADRYRRNRRLMDAVCDLPVDLDAAGAPVDPDTVTAACEAYGVTGAAANLVAAAPALVQLAELTH